MSRFYDALRQASRLVQAPDGSNTEPAWDPFALEPVSVSPAPDALAKTTVDAGSIPGPDALAPATNRPDASAAPPVTPAPDLGIDAKLDLDKKARVMPNIADNVVMEHYRRLRTKLMQQHTANPFRSLIVTSANPQEGKTVTTLNLAFSFAMIPSFRVLVVDGDLRRGSLGKWLGIEDYAGLSNLIEGTASPAEVVLRCDQMPLHLIVRGNSAIPAAELLHSPALGQQIRILTQSFDLVLVDSPPVNLITDTQLMASHCDAVLLVARAFSTRCKSFEKMVQDLSSFRILGTVLNGGSKVSPYGSYGGYY